VRANRITPSPENKKARSEFYSASCKTQRPFYVKTILSPSFNVTMAFFQPGAWPACEVRWRRAAIEPVISHLKHQHRLARCLLKGFVGDQVNLLLAAAA